MARLIPVKLYYFEACCATPDAEETALLYARLSNVAYAMFEALGRFSRFTYNPEKVCIYPDYTKEKSVYKLKLLIKIRLVYLLTTGFDVLGVIFKDFSGKSQSNKLKKARMRQMAANRKNTQSQKSTSEKNNSSQANKNNEK